MSKLKNAKKKQGRFSNDELLALVLFLSAALDEAVDAVYIAAFEDSLPEFKQLTELFRVQEAVGVIAEAAANELFGSDGL